MLPELLHFPREAGAVHRGHLRAGDLAAAGAGADAAGGSGGAGGADGDGEGGVVRARLERERHQVLRGHGRRGHAHVEDLQAHRTGTAGLSS